MNCETIKDRRDALAKIAAEQLPDCTIKTDRDNNMIGIHFPEQDGEWPILRVEIEAAGRLKRDRIRIFGCGCRSDYETNEQFARNIAKVVGKVRAKYVKDKEERRIEAERKLAEKERAKMLEKIADTAVRLAFSNHQIERFNIEGDHTGGKVCMYFSTTQRADGFTRCSILVLEYVANDANELTWVIGNKYIGVIIPDLAVFSKAIC